MPKEPRFLEAHEPTNLQEALRQVGQGDFKGATHFLLEHPQELRPFCDELKSTNPFAASAILANIITVLIQNPPQLKGLSSMEDSIAALISARLQAQDIPQDLKGAITAAIEENPLAVIAYLKANPKQILPFCKNLMDLLHGSMRVAFRLALRNGKRSQDRKNYDLAAEVIDFLREHNEANIQDMRGRIERLLAGNQMADADDAIIEALEESAREGGAVFTFNNYPVTTRMRFAIPYQQGPRGVEFVTGLTYQDSKATASELRVLFGPFLAAGIPCEIHGAVPNGAPGYVIITQAALNQAIEQGLLYTEQHDEGRDFAIRVQGMPAVTEGTVH